MPYDRSWMGYGMVGALQAGAIALAVGIAMYVLIHAYGKRNGWHHGQELAISVILAFVLAGGQDIWNLFYFNVAPLQSLALLRLKLAAVHDPDAIGLRTFFDFTGALVGVAIGWAMFSGGLRDALNGVRKS
ncbi:hypothetical protein EC912_102244 [Luteibacter rhizovicinus]|uniref:Uncharacterized protein n=1 Tax=Luteibacter rhizovicinus TaxID=242606 RepID=A0A4V2W4H3_9GAMM|nr:hypothetical protein [Luteibacter rhizovicinus]TCV95899.1 hypothetical protein EC912_102244 [Luteibacter rhizovicinus]